VPADHPPALHHPQPTLAPAAVTATSRHGAHVLDDARVRFGLWAPDAARVDLDLGGRLQPLRADGDGWWSLVAEAAHGDRYAYRLDGGEALPDPAARWLPDGVHAPAAVLDVRRLRPDALPFGAPPITGGVVYELHIGTATTEGTFAAAADEVLPGLRELGVTHVEVMPVNAFDGARGWGYDGVQWHAVHQPYGGPEGFAAFVEAAHAAGLAVILDVVHNHLGPSGNHLPRFGPYLQADAESSWGRVINLDGPRSGPVRELIIGNALMWLRDFGVDALRLDAVHALDDRGSARHLLAELSDAVAGLAETVGRPLELIAETDRNDPATITPTAQGGLGMDAQWADDLHHAIHVAVTGEVDGYYADYAEPVEALARAYAHGFVYDGSRRSAFRDRVVGAPLPPWTSSRRLIACVQNHDQVGNRPAGDRLTAQVEPDLVRVAIALLCAAPHTPMLFMGEEYGETRPFQFFSDMPGDDLREAIRTGRVAEFAYFTSWGGEVPDPLDPETFRRSTLDRRAARTPEGLARRALWTDLLALRRTQPTLGTGDRRLVSAEARDDVLVVHRRPPAHAPQAPVVRLVANLGTTGTTVETGVETGSATAALLLSTADVRYGGPVEETAGRPGPADATSVPARTAVLHALHPARPPADPPARPAPTRSDRTGTTPEEPTR
jgi:maltooligosyltrehalose trehalohydrolase